MPMEGERGAKGTTEADEEEEVGLEELLLLLAEDRASCDDWGGAGRKAEDC